MIEWHLLGRGDLVAVALGNPDAGDGADPVEEVVAVTRVLEEFHYVREIRSADDRDHALVFEARIDGTLVNGCDFLHVNDEGLIDDFVVMVRPLSGANALAEAMGNQFEQVVADATGSANS